MMDQLLDEIVNHDSSLSGCSPMLRRHYSPRRWCLRSALGPAAAPHLAAMFRRPEHARYRDAFPALARRAWALRTPARALDARSKSSSDLTRCLGAFDLLMLGVGGVIGGGVFVLTGAAAHDHAGPAVVVSYVLASLTSMVTALCYVEFAVECPVAGSAYNFVAQAFGEFAGYVAGCNLGLELTISAAAVARGWTSYVCTLFRADPDALRVRLGGILLDVPAALLVAAVTVMLARGMRNTARFNAAVTVVSLLVIGFVIVFGFAEVEPRNWSPFAPNGLPGVFSGAGVVFFSFVGFDTVATCAEETKNPGRDLPVGIMGSLGICAGLYALMSLVITGMVPTPEIDVQAPFAAAFRDKGLGWAESVISLGAVAAITTALLSSLMGQPRVYMVMARDGLLPAWIARVHERFGTPLNASAFTGVTTGALALLVDIETLAQLVSIGTLFVFGSVCAGLLARRHTPEDEAVRRGNREARTHVKGTRARSGTHLALVAQLAEHPPRAIPRRAPPATAGVLGARARRVGAPLLALVAPALGRARAAVGDPGPLGARRGGGGGGGGGVARGEKRRRLLRREHLARLEVDVGVQVLLELLRLLLLRLAGRAFPRAGREAPLERPPGLLHRVDEELLPVLPQPERLRRGRGRGSA